jgi:hypothetical protein
MYATAKSPVGPFTRASNNPILASDFERKIIGPGHHSVVRIPGTDDWFVFYHSHKGDLDRRVSIDRMAFNGDGSIAAVKATCEGIGRVTVPVSVMVAPVGARRAGDSLTITGHSAWPVESVRRVEFLDGERKLGETRRSSYQMTWKCQPGFARICVRITRKTGETATSAPLYIDIAGQAAERDED